MCKIKYFILLHHVPYIPPASLSFYLCLSDFDCLPKLALKILSVSDKTHQSELSSLLPHAIKFSTYFSFHSSIVLFLFLLLLPFSKSLSSNFQKKDAL